MEQFFLVQFTSLPGIKVIAVVTNEKLRYIEKWAKWPIFDIRDLISISDPYDVIEYIFDDVIGMCLS